MDRLSGWESLFGAGEFFTFILVVFFCLHAHADRNALLASEKVRSLFLDKNQIKICTGNAQLCYEAPVWLCTIRNRKAANDFDVTLGLASSVISCMKWLQSSGYQSSHQGITFLPAKPFVDSKTMRIVRSKLKSLNSIEFSYSGLGMSVSEQLLNGGYSYPCGAWNSIPS